MKRPSDKNSSNNSCQANMKKKIKTDSSSGANPCQAAGHSGDCVSDTPSSMMGNLPVPLNCNSTSNKNCPAEQTIRDKVATDKIVCRRCKINHRDVDVEVGEEKDKIADREEQQNAFCDSMSTRVMSDENKKEVIQKDVQEMLENDLGCAICQDIYINPLILNCSHSFCKFCVYRWLSKKTRCPQCRMTVSFQAENLALRNVINRMVQKSSVQFQETRSNSVRQRLKDEEEQEKDDTTKTLIEKFASITNGSSHRLNSPRFDVEVRGLLFHQDQFQMPRHRVRTRPTHESDDDGWELVASESWEETSPHRRRGRQPIDSDSASDSHEEPLPERRRRVRGRRRTTNDSASESHEEPPPERRRRMPPSERRRSLFINDDDSEPLELLASDAPHGRGEITFDHDSTFEVDSEDESDSDDDESSDDSENMDDESIADSSDQQSSDTEVESVEHSSESDSSSSEDDSEIDFGARSPNFSWWGDIQGFSGPFRSTDSSDAETDTDLNNGVDENYTRHQFIDDLYDTETEDDDDGDDDDDEDDDDDDDGDDFGRRRSERYSNDSTVEYGTDDDSVQL